MSLAEDQHAVGEFGSDRADESFGVAVGPWAVGWDLHDLDAGVGEHGVKARGELAGAVANQKPELRRAVTEFGDQIASLLGGPGSVGVGGGVEDVDMPGVDLDQEEYV